MDLYEYQARQLLEEQDIPTPGRHLCPELP